MPDPQWVSFPGLQSHSVGQLDVTVDLPPDIAVGAYVCSGCNTGHVFISAVLSHTQVTVGFDAVRARDIAMALLAAADRVDPQVKQ